MRQAQHLCQRTPSPVGAAFYRAHGAAAGGCRLFYGKAQCAHQNQYLALFVRQLGKCLGQIVQRKFQMIEGMGAPKDLFEGELFYAVTFVRKNIAS